MRRSSNLVPALTLAVFVALLVPIQNWIERSASAATIDDEAMYLQSGDAAKNLALGYESVLADIYWMRAIQYFGRKVIDDPTVLDTRSERLKLLYPLTNVATSLDPQLIPAYRFGAFFLQDYGDPGQARALLEKGIAANPDNVWLYQDLAFLEWHEGDCARASEIYKQGSKRPGAPAWMDSMSASVLAECGKRDLAVKMLTSTYVSTEDPMIRTDIERKLKELQAAAEVEFLQAAVDFYAERLGQRPPTLAQLIRVIHPAPQPGIPKITLDRSGTPVDPYGARYQYDPASGKVTTDPSSIRLRETYGSRTTP